MENFVTSMKEKDPSTWNNDYLMNWVKDKSESTACSLETLRHHMAKLQVEDTSHWDKLKVQTHNKDIITEVILE
jgi:hypothetical protein